MPNQQDQQAIDGLFDRIEDVARKSPPRDRDAEALIQHRLREYPPAPYYMAQTILIQEQALRQAQERIEQLEASQRPAGGFLGGLFGDAEPQHRPARSRGPWDRQQQDYDDRRGQGGGFLAGAAQTALGVTGGVLLGSAIAGMLTGGAHAAEPSAGEGADPSEDQDFDAGGDDFGGGDDFDFGGGF
ncbi:DUF2076 domain-containing protein [Devosia sp.]|uniref:DUF2076 domain-containing protein n=1 Tax=Devosia sp. TaxID=1871048 RepID=UPI002FCC2600